MQLTFEAEKMSDELTKYHIRGLGYEAVIHHFTGVDRDHAHDHPWNFTSQVLKGGYVERVWQLDGSHEDIHRKVGDKFRVPATTIHQLIELPEGQCLTFVLPEQCQQKSGFYKFTDECVMHRFWDEIDYKPLK